MLTHQLDSEAAFDLLVGHSMITDTKVTPSSLPSSTAPPAVAPPKSSLAPSPTR